jgi:hypothetical protein
MTSEFKKIKNNEDTHYVLETATSGATSAGVVATAPGKRREDSILAQEKKETPKPRNFVAKNAKMGGAGQHKDKKKAEKQGDVKHKKPLAESYAEDLAKQVFNANPNIKDENAVLDAAWPIAVKDLGNKRARSVFNYDEDFPSDLVSVYGWLQKDQQGVAEATGDERFDTMMGKITGGAGARQGVDNLNKSLAARTGSDPETALAKWGQEFIKWLEDICRNFSRQGVDRFSKLEKLSEFEDGGETMAHWLIEVAKQTKTAGITLADIQEFSSEFNTHGMWPWQQFPIAWSQNEWQDYKDQWTGPDGYIANLRHSPEQGVAEGKDDKIAQLKKDHDTAVHWSKNETSPQKREAARQKAEKIKAHLEKQYKQGVAEGQVTPNPYDRGYYDGQRMGSNSYHNPYSRADEPTEWDEYKSGFNMAQIELQNDLEDNGFSEGVAEGFNGEYDDEAGMAHTNLLTSARAVMGLLKTIDDKDNLPEWVQEKIAKAEMMLVGVWDYLQSQKEQGIDPQQDANEAYGRYDRRDAYQRDYDSSVSGMDRGNNHRDDERHDLDPTDWYIVKDGKMFKTSVYPNQEKEAMARGYSRTREEAKSKADNAMEGVDPYFESLRSKVEELAKK